MVKFRRPWLVAAILFIALKAAIIVLSAMHVRSIPRDVGWTLWWTGKIAPTVFVLALLLDARQIASKLLVFYKILLPVVIVYTAAVVYAMLHGWHGLRL